MNQDIHPLLIAESNGSYLVRGPVTPKDLYDITSAMAKHEYSQRSTLDSPSKVIAYLEATQRNIDYEVFSAIYLNNQNQLITFTELARGTIDSAAVFPREVVKSALLHGAKGVIFFHNHPSGGSEPSSEDIAITSRLKQALDLVDIKVLDHFVFGASNTTSMAERGLI